MRIACLLSSVLLFALACGPKLPPRYVLEKEFDQYKFRRYQQVLDIELPIDGNSAVGYTATYVRGGRVIRVAPVFITVYEKAAGLTETVRQRLRGMQGYGFEVEKRGGAYLYRMRGEAGDLWLLWVSGRHLVKLGVPHGEKEVPGELLEAYLDRYPSDLDKQGKAEPGAESAGPAAPGPGESPVQP